MTKPKDIDDFFRFVLTKYDSLRYPQVDPFVKFYCYFNALVRPNLHSWTRFRGLNSDDFPFFGTSLALLEAKLVPFKDWKEIGDI